MTAQPHSSSGATDEHSHGVIAFEVWFLFFANYKLPG